ncbi:chemotaxis protein CheB [Alkalibacterium iburiense]|uniref:Protein-glutamate methylesterase/protein-glutamine glutaminase n=1 Tax=Alkalibacterium iburiense TaxID=290589 RepID=A0ABN0XNU6_9LACT
MAIKVVIVDDSALMRKIVTRILEDSSDIVVVDTARNGVEALKVVEKSQPDLVILDVEMPMMNGIETLKILKENSSIPVIMFSAKSNHSITIQALELGAEDFIEKPLNIKENWDVFKKDLEKRIKIHFLNEKKPFVSTEPTNFLPKELVQKKESLKAIVIGASTGGPRALVSLVKALPENLTIPVFIVQHMPEGFTASFAQRLNDLAKVEVREASHNEPIQSGTVYLAPGGKHMTIMEKRLLLNDNEKLHGVKPAIDYLFDSASIQYQDGLLGIVLTGMGRDGAAGSGIIREAGGYIITQDKATSVVYGMPKVVVERGYSNQSNSLSEIADIIKEMTR